MPSPASQLKHDTVRCTPVPTAAKPDHDTAQCRSLRCGYHRWTCDFNGNLLFATPLRQEGSHTS